MLSELVLLYELEGADDQSLVLILRPINSASAVVVVSHKNAEIAKTQLVLLILLIEKLARGLNIPKI